jgi:hypothetical protein
MVLTILSRIDDTYSPHVPLNAGVTETPPRTAVRTCEGTLMHRTKTVTLAPYNCIHGVEQLRGLLLHSDMLTGINSTE